MLRRGFSVLILLIM